jgi:subtilisin family serine protease
VPASSAGSAGPALGNGFDHRRGGPPPRGERRFVPDEVITEFTASASPQAIARLARRFRLTRLESQRFALMGATLYRWRTGRRSVSDVVRALGRERLIASVQPNYLFALQEQPGAGDGTAQYVLARLDIPQAHQIATGKAIAVAVIDSAVDTTHPDLDGSVGKSFDALGGAEKPQQHGTAMAGAIASHGKLIGIAPGAQILAARAFDDSQGVSQGTSFAIYKALRWAADNGARVVNMSFVGPQDPDMHRLLAGAYAKDLVLVAAAGNAGPQSAPLYPAADPDVIAVTATDSRNAVFKAANRGAYVAVAAPGVDILALAPGDSYQVTTGTSIAAAHVSGVAALLLQREPSLKPKDIRAILTATAKPLAGAVKQPSDVGVGLVDAYGALGSVDRTSAKR